MTSVATATRTSSGSRRRTTPSPSSARSRWRERGPSERISLQANVSYKRSALAAGHFRNGRSIAAFRLQTMRPLERALRIAGCLVLPPVMLWRTTHTVRRKRHDPAQLFASLPAMLWLLLCHAAGELCGYVAGPGTSPERVR